MEIGTQRTNFMFLLTVVWLGLLCPGHGQDTGVGDDTGPGGDPSGPGETLGSDPSRPTLPPLPTFYPPGIQVSCPMRYKCNERFGLPLNYHDKNCYCDVLCETYGDCCKDYVSPSGKGKRTKLPRNTFACQRVEEIDRSVEIYVVERCPRDFTDSDIRAKCEGPISTDDAFQRIPVVSKETRVLYKNFFCAQCGGEMNVSFWRVLLNCQHIPEPLSNISSKAVLEGAVGFAEKNRQFCGTLFDAPSDDLKARTCKSNIGRCDRSYTADKRIAKKCRSQTSYVYVGLEVFKNKYCAQCNYVNESYLSCEDTRTPRIVFEEPPLMTAPFSILLDLNTGAGSISEHRRVANDQIQVSEVASTLQPCPDNHIYDHFKRQCRMLVCTGTHHLVSGDCVPINPESEPTTEESLQSPVESETPSPGVDNLNPSDEHDSEGPGNPNENHSNKNSDGGDHGQGGGNFDPEFPDRYNYDNDRDGYQDPHHNYRDPIYDPDGIISSDPDRMDTDPNLDPNSPTDVQLDCPSLMKLNDTEYRRFDNHSSYVFALNQIVHAQQIQYDGRFAYICSPYTGQNNAAAVNATVIMFEFTYLQKFISFVGLLVSMMSLLIMFIIYCAYKQLRGIAGVSAMSLALALFVAQGIFLFGLRRPDLHTVCLSLGALMHYFFMAAFFWLNVMSFDIYRTFSDSYEPSASCCGGRFACYFFYAWFTPACIVGAALSLDFFQYAEDIYQPHYAETICWIVRRYALLFMFALPLAILLAMNIIIYIISLLKSITANKEKGRGRLLLYIQLSFVMGLTWIFAFVATLTDMWIFWYVFIAFNSFQGIFISFAFVCNRKVFRIIKSKGKVQQQLQKKDVRFSNGHHRTFSSARHTFLTDGEARIIAQETSI